MEPKEIAMRQSTISEKQKLLQELRLNETSLIKQYQDVDADGLEDWQLMLRSHAWRCEYNVCGLDYLSFGVTKSGKLQQFRLYVNGDAKSRCSLNRKDRELIYEHLTPEQKALLPNKGLCDYEIQEDLRLARMTEAERAAYLAKQAERAKKWFDSLHARKNSTDGERDVSRMSCKIASDGIKLPSPAHPPILLSG